MGHHDHSAQRSETTPGFWRSRAGLVLIGFLAIAGLMLAYEHRVHILTGNGLLAVLLLACIGMHFFMHGGHGRHDGGNRWPDGEGE